MSVSSYFQQLLAAVSRLEDYGLVNTITSNSETRPSGELFINIKTQGNSLKQSRILKKILFVRPKFTRRLGFAVTLFSSIVIILYSVRRFYGKARAATARFRVGV